jgi:hypothetical protein
VLFWNTQLPVPLLHESLVHKLLSLHTVALPGLQAEAAHTSPTEHALPSLHGEVLALNAQPSLASQLSSVQGLLSLQPSTLPDLHTPLEHASPTVHTLPSASQVVPSLLATMPHLPVLVAQMLLAHTVFTLVSQLTTVAGLTLQLYGKLLLSQKSVPLHKLPSSWPAQSLSMLQPQVLVPDLHVPAAHTSPVVQPLPSSQLAVLLLWLQPVEGTQPSVVQGFPSSHRLAGLTAVPLQVPALHASLVVQALPSLHATVLAELTQPALGSHESLVHTLLSLQLTALPTHAPPAHVSPWLQALPSSQPSVLFANMQAPVLTLHESLVHALPSLHTVAGPALHALFWHTSPTVHGLPSLQGRVLGLLVQPSLVSHASSVHGLLSLQFKALPAVHRPAVQMSGLVQTEPSASQAPPLFCAT